MTRKPVYLAALAATLVLPFAARADDDHGHGHGHGNHKEKYWDGNCEVERKWKHGEWEEKRKCRAPERIVVVPAPAPQTVVVVPAPAPQAVVVYPPWIVRQHNEYVYEPSYQPPPQRVVTGTYQCNSATVGRVLGGIVGGTLGNQVGQGNGRTAATIGGAVAGVLVGGEIGKRMDAGRQGCVGQVLEIAPVNHRVQWVEGPANYVVVPGKVISRSGGHCRPYTVEMRMNGRVERTNGTACRRPDGVWVAA
jgi:surface antigen